MWALLRPHDMRSPAYIEKRATEEVTDLERPTQLSHTHVRHAKKKKNVGEASRDERWCTPSTKTQWARVPQAQAA